MKIAAILLSLILNIALATLITQRWSHSKSTSATQTTTAEPTSPQSPDRLDQTWNQLTAAKDDAAFIARLRAEGIPPRLIRALAYEQVRARYASRMSALTNKDAAFPYWRTQPWSYNFNPETRAERRAIETEIADEVKKLLGPNAIDSESDYSRGERIRSFGSIPQEKVTALQAIQKDYSELNSQIREAAKGVVLAEDREKLAFLEKEKRADLVRLLSPEELDEYDRRNSPAASDLRGRTRYFDLTEKEFIDLYHIQRDFDTRYGRDNLTGEQADRRRAAQTELTAQFEASLGPERFAEYQITTDGNYSGTQSFVKFLGLPPETTRQLVSLQRSATERANALRADKSLSREQQSTQLAQLEKEAQEKLTATLGAENSTTYKERLGQWLARLSPQSKMPTPR